MRIYTGYFGGMRHYVGLRYVAISRSVPIGLKWRVPNCRALNPTLGILQMKDRPAEYEKGVRGDSRKTRREGDTQFHISDVAG